ncbi:MAG: hypothetical protein RL254_1582 [Planctomycetota bacterium]|jgi:hypothetical protein
MSIKSFAFGVVGAVVCASAAQGQSDCNANALSDTVEIVSGRAFDENQDGVIDSCAWPVTTPKLSSVTIYGASGGHWDTFGPPEQGCWDIWIRRAIGTWMNDSATPVGNAISAEIELNRGNNVLTMHRNASDPTNRMLLAFATPSGGSQTATATIYINGEPVLLDLGLWKATVRNFVQIPTEEDLVGGFATGADGRSDSVTSVEIVVELRPEFDCNQNGLPDINDIASTPALDCNSNSRIDTCESGYNDCNSNSLPDSCDITSGTSADADSNGIPDSCQPDCNLNNLPDAWEIATGRATDYNADGIPDTCQGAVMVDSTTDNLGAPSGLATREHSFTALPFAESAVTITIDLIGDLNRVNEFVEVSLNGGTPRRFFEADGNDCPATPDRAIITLTRAEFNALISPNGGTGAILVVAMTGSAGVDSSECKNAALTQFRLQYVGIQAKSGDCNGNNRLDIAETHDGTTPDCNLNTVPDSCDIARGAAQDCNLNGVPDSCELATTPVLDCNTNGIIDSCDLANGGTTVDCDQNSRIDSCQVTETPGTDCNGNLRPDACDIASGTSGDIDHNGTPDECQTVTVPGQYAGIQAAIDAAPASEMRIISVAAGTYAGPIAFNGKPVIVRGASAASTVIDGASGQTLSVVRFNGGEPAIAALERVTVRGGITGTPIPSSPTVLAGGGIFGLDSAASVRDCVVEQNASGFGAGAYFLRCTGEVRGCTFRNNNASSDGGGFQSNQGSQQLTDVLIENNVCNSRGAGMHLVQGTPTLTRVTVRNNYSNNLIGGVSWYALGDATAAAMLDACVVTGNSALVTQGGIGISAASVGVPTISLRASNVCNNTPRPNISGAWLDLGGNSICDCVGDLTLDGLVNGADLGILLAGWGACTGSCASDLNRDGVVNGADLGVLLSAWGTCGG